MRLDKYLKVSRIIKRRTVANEACDAGKVEVTVRLPVLRTTLKWAIQSKSLSAQEKIHIRCLQLMSTLLKRTLPKCTRCYKERTAFLLLYLYHHLHKII